MKVCFIGKRHYTNRDALAERYGRIYQLPLHWSGQGVQTRLWLIDYHNRVRAKRQDGALPIDSTPIRGLGWMHKAAVLPLARFGKERTTHIVASGDAYIGLLGWLLARLTGARFVFDVYDKYDEFSGYCKPLGLDLFGFLLRHADQCWFASRRLLSQLGIPARGDRLVMNGIDTNHFRPRDMREARQRLGLPEGMPLVGYFGSMEQDRGVNDLIEAVSLLRQQNHDISLLLAGKPHPDTPLPQADWLIYLGNLPHDQVLWALAAANVIASPYRRSPFLDSASSVKFGEILACERPLVVTRTPNFVDNFPVQTQELDDYLVPPEQPGALASAIARQLHDKKIASAPIDMEWSALAGSSLAALRAINPIAQPASFS